MRFTKTLCGVTAALTVLSSTAIAAQAEETQLKLLTAPIDSNTLSNYGGGYYWDGTNVLKISEDELVEWRKSGTLSAKIVESDAALSGLTNMSGSFDGGYKQFAKVDANGSVSERYLMRVDKESGKISTMSTLGADWCYTNNDGYTFGCKQSEKALEITVYDTKGTKKTASIPFVDENFSDFWGASASYGGENVGYVIVKTGESNDFNPSYELYAVKKDASIELIAKNNLEGSKTGFGIIGSGEDGVVFVEHDARVISSKWMLYSFNDGKIYDLNSCMPDGESYYLAYSSVTGKKYGSNIILGIDSSFTNGTQMYVLMNYKENKPVSKLYTNIATNDGKIYAVQTKDGKYGYIDANGKELAMFDRADVFIGDYAPVVKDGKAYLIDRSMNKVSDEAAADAAVTLDKELFAFAKGDDITLVTYTETQKQSTTSETVSDPTSSELTASSTTESSTSSTDTPSINNPATGITMAMIPVAMIGGAAVVAAKKRKK